MKSDGGYVKWSNVVGSDEEKIYFKLTVALLDCKVFCLISNHASAPSILRKESYADPQNLERDGLIQPESPREFFNCIEVCYQFQNQIY